MNIKKQLYKVYNRRRFMLVVFNISILVLIALLPLGFIMDAASEGLAENDFFAFLALMAFVSVFVLIILICFLLPIKQGLKEAKIKIDYMYYCLMKFSVFQQDMIASEADDFFGKADRTIEESDIYFGRYCLYGKTAWTDFKVTSYHVIIPYENIKQVFLWEPAEKEWKEKLSDIVGIIITAANVAGAFAGTEPGVFISNKVEYNPFIVVDTDNNIHCVFGGVRLAATDENIFNYAEQIIKHAPHVEIGYLC